MHNHIRIGFLLWAQEFCGFGLCQNFQIFDVLFWANQNPKTDLEIMDLSNFDARQICKHVAE